MFYFDLHSSFFFSTLCLTITQQLQLQYYPNEIDVPSGFKSIPRKTTIHWQLLIMYLHKDSQHSFMISYFGFYRRNFKKRIESLKKNISRKKLHSVVSSLLCVLRSSNSRKFISIRSRPYDCLTRSSTYKRMCDNIICRFLWSDAVWRKRAVDDVGRHENVKFRSETTPRVCSSVENVLVGVRYGYPVSLYGRRYYKCIPNTHLDCLTTRFQKRYLFIVYYLSSILSKRRLHKKSRAELEKNARPSSTRTVTYDTPV